MSENIYGQAEKKFIFKDTAKNHADLLLKLEYDSLTQAKFFRLCIQAYLNDNESMREIIDSTKTNKGIKNKIEKDYKELKQTKQKFQLDDLEIENIYDIVDEEHPDL